MNGHSTRVTLSCLPEIKVSVVEMEDCIPAGLFIHNQSISLSTDILRPLLDFVSWRSSIFVLLSMCLVGTGGILVLGRSSVAKTIVKRPRTDILLLRSRASLIYYKKLITRLKDYKNIGLKIKRSDWVILVIAGLFV